MKMLHGVTKGLPQTGLQGGAGVGLFYLHRMLANKIAFLQNLPLAAPIGIVLKKSGKLGAVAPALIGAGGYAGAQAYELKKAVQNMAQVAPANQPGAAGLDDAEDTGALTNAQDIGALLESANVGSVEDSDRYADAYNIGH
jgi:hypothetical protein